MNTISDKDLDILIIRNQLYEQRIKDEIEDLENKKKSIVENKQEESEDYQNISSRLEYLNNILKTKEEKVNNQNIETLINQKSEVVVNNEFKKTWGRMNINCKRIKVQEYCDLNNIEESLRNQYLKMVDEKQLKTKNVKYDQKKQQIIEIKI